jgi:2-dehydro-3-deoxyphosphogluconate aldolase/(4S)-4-hydroxy-2-oxoglutarate aldolase
MNQSMFPNRLVSVAIIERKEDAVPLAGALLAGGLTAIEITLRTPEALQCIAAIKKAMPQMVVGAGTVLSVDQFQKAVDAGAQFGVSPGLSERVVEAARSARIPFYPGVLTPTEVARALDLGLDVLKFFPAEAGGGVPMLKALSGPFAHTGVRFIPTGGITAANLGSYAALKEVAAIGGSWMVERKLVAEKAWAKITALTAEAVAITGKAV